LKKAYWSSQKPGKSGAGGNKKKEWKWTQALSFLKAGKPIPNSAL